ALAEEALLQGHQVAPVSRLEAQGIAAQAVVSPQKDLVFRIEAVADLAFGAAVEDVVAEVPRVVAQARSGAEVLGLAGTGAGAALDGGEEELAPAGTPAGGGSG